MTEQLPRFEGSAPAPEENERLPSFESMAGRLRLTVGGPLLDYVRALVGTSLYGDTEGDVIRTLVREGVRGAIERGFIKQELVK